jgi:hypothetical protein
MTLNYKRIIYNLKSSDSSRNQSTVDLKIVKKAPIKKEIKKGGDKKGQMPNKKNDLNWIANVTDIVELAVINCPFQSALIGEVFNY